jgi:hypothetical protein
VPVTDRTTALAALEVANETREVRARQRMALRGAPPHTMLPVLIDPPAELASYRLGELFAARSLSLIPFLGAVRLTRILSSLNRRSGLSRRWDEHTRLRDLSTSERRMLAEELQRHGPPSWRKS